VKFYSTFILLILSAWAETALWRATSSLEPSLLSLAAPLALPNCCLAWSAFSRFSRRRPLTGVESGAEMRIRNGEFPVDIAEALTARAQTCLRSSGF